MIAVFGASFVSDFDLRGRTASHDQQQAASQAVFSLLAGCGDVIRASPGKLFLKGISGKWERIILLLFTCLNYL